MLKATKTTEDVKYCAVCGVRFKKEVKVVKEESSRQRRPAKARKPKQVPVKLDKDI